MQAEDRRWRVQAEDRREGAGGESEAGNVSYRSGSGAELLNRSDGRWRGAAANAKITRARRHTFVFALLPRRPPKERISSAVSACPFLAAHISGLRPFSSVLSRKTSSRKAGESLGSIFLQKATCNLQKEGGNSGGRGGNSRAATPASTSSSGVGGGGGSGYSGDGAARAAHPSLAATQTACRLASLRMSSCSSHWVHAVQPRVRRR